MQGQEQLDPHVTQSNTTAGVFPWISPQVATALWVPDMQAGIRTQPMGNKEVASVPDSHAVYMKRSFCSGS